MEIEGKEHRRARLIELVEYRREHQGMSKAEFAAKASMEPTYLSRLLSDPDKKQHRAIELTAMSKIIEGHELSSNWFNLPMGSELEPANDRKAALAKVYGLSPMAISLATYFNARVPADQGAQVEAFNAAQDGITTWLEQRKNSQSSELAPTLTLRKSRARRRART